MLMKHGMHRFLMLSAALLLMAATSADASVIVVTPEVDPSTLSVGLALLAGGVLMVRARRRR
jgi:hypothetical protein